MGCSSSKGGYPAELPDGVVLGPGVEILGEQSTAAVQETVDMASRSYAGTATAAPPTEFDWMLPQFPDRADPAQQKERSHRCAATIAYCVNFGFVIGSRGLVLIARDDAEAKVKGVAVVHFYPEGWTPSKNGMFAQTNAAMKAGKYVPWDKAQQEFTSEKGRDGALQKVLASLHGKHAAGPHIYVEILAVDPDAQGQGVGSKLMRTVSAIADAAKLPVYLECDSGKNQAVYQKFGYATVGTEAVKFDDKGVVSEMPGEMCAMRRELKE